MNLGTNPLFFLGFIAYFLFGVWGNPSVCHAQETRNGNNVTLNASGPSEGPVQVSKRADGCRVVVMNSPVEVKTSRCANNICLTLTIGSGRGMVRSYFFRFHPDWINSCAVDY